MFFFIGASENKLTTSLLISIERSSNLSLFFIKDIIYIKK